MNRILLATLVLITLFGLAFIGSAFSMTHIATCTGVPVITPANQFANIRREATTTSSVAYELKKGEVRQFDTLSNGWYHLIAGGFVHESVVTEQCLPRPTQQPIVVTVRPPAPNAGPVEKHIVCPTACEITIIVEELP